MDSILKVFALPGFYRIERVGARWVAAAEEGDGRVEGWGETAEKACGALLAETQRSRKTRHE
jgi:hypothetical protein